METHHLIVDCSQLTDKWQKYDDYGAKKPSGQQPQRRRYLTQSILNLCPGWLSEPAVGVEPATGQRRAEIQHNWDERRDGEELHEQRAAKHSASADHQPPLSASGGAHRQYRQS